MIGSLLYVSETRPDIMQASGVVVEFQSNTKETQLQAVQKILLYLKGTLEFVLIVSQKRKN